MSQFLPFSCSADASTLKRTAAGRPLPYCLPFARCYHEAIRAAFPASREDGEAVKRDWGKLRVMLLTGAFRLGAFLVLIANLCLVRAQEPGKPNPVPPPAPSRLTDVSHDTPAVNIRPGKVIRSDVDLALVNVTVTDPFNRLVTGLEQDNFRVYEDNIEQEIPSLLVLSLISAAVCLTK
jgi:hypothetical protein